MMTLSPIDLILGRLRDRGCNPRQSRDGQWTAKCPNTARHNRGDKNPSLSVGTGNTGKALVHCHTGCTPQDIATALDMRVADLFPPEQANGKADRPRRVVTRYSYCDEDGEIVYEVERMEPKGFRQRRPLPDGSWVYSLQGIDRRPLYCLPAVRAAIDEGRPVWLCEGEKDAEAIAKAVLPDPATTMSGGVDGWRPEHVEQLAGAALVHVVADDDTAGHKHARKVAKQLLPHVGRIIVHLPHKGHKDAAEHLGAGRSIDDLRTWWDSADGELDDADEAEGEDSAESVSRLRSALVHGEDITNLPPVEWLVHGVIQKQSLVSIYGAPKSGKSFFAVDLAMRVSLGEQWRGRAVEQTRVLYVIAEGAPGVGPRASAWVAQHGGHMGGMSWITVAPSLFRGDEDVADIVGIAREFGCGLVIIDTLARSIPGADENSAKDFGLVIENLDYIRVHAGATVAVVHHAGKDGTRGMRGSSALHGAIDTGIEVVRDGDDVKATLVDQKNAESGDSWWWHATKLNGSLVLTSTMAPRSTDEILLLNVLRQLHEKGGSSSFGDWQARCKDVLQLPTHRFRTLRDSAVNNGWAAESTKGNSKVYSLTEAGRRQLVEATESGSAE